MLFSWWIICCNKKWIMWLGLWYWIASCAIVPVNGWMTAINPGWCCNKSSTTRRCDAESIWLAAVEDDDSLPWRLIPLVGCMVVDRMTYCKHRSSMWRCWWCWFVTAVSASMTSIDDEEDEAYRYWSLQWPTFWKYSKMECHCPVRQYCHNGGSVSLSFLGCVTHRHEADTKDEEHVRCWWMSLLLMRLEISSWRFMVVVPVKLHRLERWCRSIWLLFLSLSLFCWGFVLNWVWLLCLMLQHSLSQLRWVFVLVPQNLVEVMSRSSGTSGK